MEVHGSVAPRFAGVRDVLADVLAGQPGTGASFAVWHDGDWVVDLWGGYADAAHTRPWRQDTLVMPYSVTKPFAALCVLTLADRGLVDLDAPMQRYWPELRAAATVRDVLSHRAGRRRPGRGRPGGGVLRLGPDVLPAGPAGAGLGAGDRAGRVGALLRPPARPGGPPGRRPLAGAVPPRGDLRPARPGLPHRARRRRAGQGRRPDRVRRGVPGLPAGRAGAVPPGDREPAGRAGPPRRQRRAVAPGRGAGGQRPRHRACGGRVLRGPGARATCSAPACWES